ncbi:hypothetical protein NEILACOT_03302 [Neisseria lactamica ATCC 23970]|uniref:Uncharacterized protein n=1 Tax=Neisseria lactamica ATCC 23970 TaxID=546265 RepID=D0W710_NEILA|nr:hypothetical protein NEILACOT_03302 [Neisseria lactamica ATCC 23970]
MVQIKVVRAAGVARGLHTEFARTVTAEEIAFDNAVLNYEARCGSNAFRIKIAAAERAGDVRFFAQVKEIGQDLFPYAVDQEAALAVERAAGERTDEVSDQTSRNGGIEEDGVAACRDAAAAESVQSAAGGGLTDGFGAVHIRMAAGGIVPVVALHSAFVGGNDAAGNAVVRALPVCGKTVGVAVNVLVMAGLHRRPFGVFDAAVRVQRCLFALFCQADGGFRIQIPFVVEVGVADVFCHQLGVGKSGAIVFGGVAGDVDGGFDGVLQGFFGEIGSAGAAFAFADVNGNVQRFVLLELDLFDFAQAHADALTERLAEIGFGGGCARRFCQVERAAAEVEEFGSGVVE